MSTSSYPQRGINPYRNAPQGMYDKQLRQRGKQNSYHATDVAGMSTSSYPPTQAMKPSTEIAVCADINNTGYSGEATNGRVSIIQISGVTDSECTDRDWWREPFTRASVCRVSADVTIGMQALLVVRVGYDPGATAYSYDGPNLRFYCDLRPDSGWFANVSSAAAQRLYDAEAERSAWTGYAIPQFGQFTPTRTTVSTQPRQTIDHVGILRNEIARLCGS